MNTRERQDIKCVQCGLHWTKSEIKEGLFCPKCFVFTQTLFDKLGEYVEKNGPIKL